MYFSVDKTLSSNSLEEELSESKARITVCKMTIDNIGIGNIN
jgi:hypothetical protein